MNLLEQRSGAAFGAILLLAACGGDAPEAGQTPAGEQASDAGDASGASSSVVTTESGLRIETLREGDGASAATGQRVTVHYRGTLPDGTQFDSSYDRGEPTEFAVAGVIPGFSETLRRMRVGGHVRVYIPSDRAYGERGGPAGSGIGPNQDLIFEIELLAVS